MDKMDKTMRAEVIKYITSKNDGYGHTAKEKIKALDYILKSGQSYSRMTSNALDTIRCNQGSHGDGRSIASAELDLWLIDILERWV